jgi:hypothetical protein
LKSQHLKIEYNFEDWSGKEIRPLRRRRTVEELSVEELRQILVEKRRAEREQRLERFRRTGRVVRVEPQPNVSAFQSIQPFDEVESNF